MSDNPYTLAGFRVRCNRKKLRTFYTNLRAYSQASPRLYVKYHASLNNIECMVAEDLADGFPNLNFPKSPKKRATEFLIAMADIMGLDETLLRRHLFLKHSIRSDLGTHCIFGLRDREIEWEQCGFVVHVSNSRKIVMLTATYQILKELTEPPVGWQEAINQGLAKYIQELKGEEIKRISHLGRVCTPNWDQGIYEIKYKVKVTTTRKTSVVMVSADGKLIDYAIDAHDLPAQFTRAYIYDERHMLNPEYDYPTVPVVLREISQAQGMLAGRYVAVVDHIMREWPTKMENDPTKEDTHFDRVMAYYHLDRIQRYLRLQGLTFLDDCPSLNPIHVWLVGKGRNHYNTEEQHIELATIEKIAEGYPWTNARSALTLYHEFIHAVTDAIAHIRRTDMKGPRMVELLQAAAIDEGFADYFACSLTSHWRHSLIGYWPLEATADDTTKFAFKIDPDKIRSLSEGAVNLGISNTKNVTASEKLIYEWGGHWGRYLWRLRRKLGVETADILIAHSLLFITRWSSFVTAVWGVVMADRLLFAGMHETAIMMLAKQKLANIESEEEWDYAAQKFSNRGGMAISFSPTLDDTNEPEEADLDWGEVWTRENGQVIVKSSRKGAGISSGAAQ